MDQHINFKIDDRTVVQATTKKEANKLCKLLDKLGARWIDGKKYVKDNYWGVEGSTCYDLHAGKIGKLSFYKNNEYKIISVNEFIKLHKPVKSTLLEMFINRILKRGGKYCISHLSKLWYESPEPVKPIRKLKICIFEDTYRSSLETKCNDWIDKNNYEIQNIVFSVHLRNDEVIFCAVITYIE